LIALENHLPRLRVPWVPIGRWPTPLTALDLREKKLGPTHPDTLATAYSLALDLASQNRKAEARPDAKRAAEGARKNPNDPNSEMYFRFWEDLSQE